MGTLFTGTDVGRKNIVFGALLFVALGVVIGVPLTVDMFGGSMLSGAQYQTWKVIHGYGVFLALINLFVGLTVDRLDLPRRLKEVASYSILAAGLFGGVGRGILVLLSALGQFGRVASLGETVFMVLGVGVFLKGEMSRRRVGLSTVPSDAHPIRAEG